MFCFSFFFFLSPGNERVKTSESNYPIRMILLGRLGAMQALYLVRANVRTNELKHLKQHFGVCSNQMKRRRVQMHDVQFSSRECILLRKDRL